MQFSDICYGNGTAEVVRDDSFIIVRLTGEHADTEAYVIARALNDAYTSGYGDGSDDTYDKLREDGEV